MRENLNLVKIAKVIKTILSAKLNLRNIYQITKLITSQLVH